MTTTSTPRSPRIAVPAEAVRSREQILAGATLIGGHIWTTCHNCGGSGNYPSSMTPPGMCRLYCWQNRTPETYGKLPVPVDTYVKRAQANDRREYRAKVRWELDAPRREQESREAAERAEIARLEREAREQAERERKAISQWIGTEGERVIVTGRVERVRSFQQQAFRSRYTETRFVISLRDAQGNVVVWFAGSAPEEGATITVHGTVKQHGQFRDEKQTTLQRVKVED
jgi:hypothetical protein